jgi:AcrR family transcriptional regulator
MGDHEADPMKIRPKSSHRKQRAASLPKVQRDPAQERSRRRHEEILQAAESLLETINIEDLNHAEVAKKANISKPSVHYHFPTISALQFAIGRRHDALIDQILDESHERLTAMRVPTWQEWIRIEAGLARDYFNSCRPACEALLGPLLNRENRLAGMQTNRRVGLSKLHNLHRIFEIPNPASLEAAFQYNGEMYDLFWSGSYQLRGHIDEEAFEESVRAVIGYLRNFLPDVLPMRATPAAVPQGEPPPS